MIKNLLEAPFVKEKKKAFEMINWIHYLQKYCYPFQTMNIHDSFIFFIDYFPCILILEKVMIWINFLPLSLFLLIVFARCRLWCFKKVMAIEAMKTRSLITHTVRLGTFTEKIMCWGCLQLLEFILGSWSEIFQLYILLSGLARAQSQTPH